MDLYVRRMVLSAKLTMFLFTLTCLHDIATGGHSAIRAVQKYAAQGVPEAVVKAMPQAMEPRAPRLEVFDAVLLPRPSNYHKLGSSGPYLVVLRIKL